MTTDVSLGAETLRQWIGREETVSDIASEDLARKLHVTLGLKGHYPQREEPLPLLSHFCLCQPAIETDNLGHDGHPKKGLFLPPVPLPRRMWAGGRLTFHEPLRVGDEVTRNSTIIDVRHKEGRSGSLCFVTVRHRIDAGGRTNLEEEQDIVYREAVATGVRPAGSMEPARVGRDHRTIATSSTLLFRYSALTFNSHRIHYDRPYAIEEEGYPGLVLHGPLQATLLANFAAELKGRMPSQFEFRSLSPIFDLQPILLNAEDDEEGTSLWTAHPGGPVAMSARAIF